MNKKSLDADPIYVTRSVVPDSKIYSDYVAQILTSRNLTNSGALAKELEAKLCSFLDVPHLALCTNGTLALQLSLRATECAKGEIITTPFSYVASVSAILWEGYTPIFADIDEETLCLDPRNLKNTLSEATAGIVPVHVYGNACDVEAINSFAAAHNLTTIYDAAQAFGCEYKGKSLSTYGDFAALSFHATKVFHTVEGGGVVCHSDKAFHKLGLLRAFGHIGDTYYTLGINAKMTELHAAMGLCLLDKVNDNIAGRKRVSEQYDSLFPSQGLRKPKLRDNLSYNYSYYPIIFESAGIMQKALSALKDEKIFPRRYFYPSLNTLPYLKQRASCPVSEDIASRVLSLPLYTELDPAIVERIMRIILRYI